MKKLTLLSFSSGSPLSTPLLLIMLYRQFSRIWIWRIWILPPRSWLTFSWDVLEVVPYVFRSIMDFWQKKYIIQLNWINPRSPTRIKRWNKNFCTQKNLPWKINKWMARKWGSKFRYFSKHYWHCCFYETVDGNNLVCIIALLK